MIRYEAKSKYGCWGGFEDTLDKAKASIENIENIRKSKFILVEYYDRGNNLIEQRTSR